jgi:hypothetical protein
MAASDACHLGTCGFAVALPEKVPVNVGQLQHSTLDLGRTLCDVGVHPNLTTVALLKVSSHALGETPPLIGCCRYAAAAVA